MKNKLNFEENYFEGHYKKIADFTEKRNKEMANWFRGIFEYINRYYPIKEGKGKKLIEFGCATGVASSVLKKFGYDVTATDISKYAVTRAKKKFKGIKFAVQDIEKPLRGEKFDSAMALDVIEHLPNPELGIRNIYNLLKKGGTAIFLTPNDSPYASNDPTHVSVKSPKEWKKIFKKIGFKNIFMKQVTLMPYIYRWHWRLVLVFPFAIVSPYLISPVIIIAKK
ncbi:MAG: class I SAM-dependent methyltransferase [Patescibacteria group bacterium]|nr:class I SAM-dependent methyltransferase [Patescibacteria group bacterium]